LVSLLRKARLQASSDLMMFLNRQAPESKWSDTIAIDEHAVFPDCHFIYEKTPHYDVAVDESIDAGNGRRRFAKLFGLTEANLNELADKYGRVSERNEVGMVKFKGGMRVLDGKPSPDRDKLYVDRMDPPPILDSFDPSNPPKIRLGRVKFSVILAIRNALEADHVEVNGVPVNFRNHVLKRSNKVRSYRNIFVGGGVGVHVSVTTSDKKLVLLRRSARTEFYGNKWSMSTDESMNGDISYRGGADKDFEAAAVRGLREELGIAASRKRIKMAAFAGEYDDLEFSVHAHHDTHLTSADVKSNWPFSEDSKESNRLGLIPLEPAHLASLIVRGFPSKDGGSYEKLSPDGTRLNVFLLMLRKFGWDTTRKSINSTIARTKLDS